MKKAIPKSELWLIKKYLLNAINYVPHDTIESTHDLVLWILENQRQLELPENCQLDENQILCSEDDDEPPYLRRVRLKKNKRAFQNIWKDWSVKFARHVKSSKVGPHPQIQGTAKWVGKLCDLDKSEVEVILYLALCEKHKIAKSLSYAAEDSMRNFNSVKYGVDEESLQSVVGLECETIYGVDGLKTLKYGIIDSRQSRIRLSRNIRKMFLSGIANEDDVRKLVIGEKSTAKLSLNDFAYLGESVETLSKILKSHNEALGKPLNIFLYGEPGTGKTEFAKSIGAAVARAVYFIGEQDEFARDVNRDERVSSLMLLSGIKDDLSSKILVLDEADEILSDIGSDSNARNKGSKIYLNRLLEKIKTPVIWIVNKHRKIDDAVLRRMSYCIEFPEPPIEVRKAIITKLVKTNKLKIASADISGLAQYEASPAYFENAIRVSKSINGDVTSIKQILENNMGTKGRVKKQIAAKVDFKIELCNANADLIALRDRVNSCTKTKLTFCFSGLPGTGKSEYAKFLAKELGYEILYKRYSDLASMWVGGTEENIAQAFREATQKKSFLILDEADSLLMRRENAQKSWEVTQVNEFLTQIENHEYPFAITTNAFDNLDTAAMRRFLFKVKFFAMESAQIEIAFQYFFNADAPKELLRTDGLTPADFALVRNQAKILGIEDKYMLSQMLLEEVATRGNGRGRIGF